MARRARIECFVAFYQVMSRGDQWEAIGPGDGNEDIALG
jgi:hypothetical protein